MSLNKLERLSESRLMMSTLFMLIKTTKATSGTLMTTHLNLFCLPFCDYCQSSNHDAYNCPCHDYFEVLNAKLEKTINDMTDKIIDTMKEKIIECSNCFNPSWEYNNVHEPTLL